MKHKTLLASMTLALTGLAIAAAPAIDKARVDAVLKQMAETAPPEAGEPPAELRADVEKRLAADDILKNEAVKLGLDKKPEIQAQWKNLEARFYADQYAEHLAASFTAGDEELKAAYAEQTRAVRLQQVGFASEAEALQAQQLLLKGLSFEELMKRYPNPAQEQLAGFVPLAQLPPELAAAAAPMQRGQISHKPVAFGGGYYLLKIAATGQAENAPSFEELKDQITTLIKQRKAREKIAELLKANGINL
ncbi:peptidylprolyl isomerase [Kingella potus]|uniref:peptidylprolyl isomerase n=1 Tax=Kingella potus TaxID=265175 RepID=A0A377R335_9NEIS|nr:peptidylprolyl isomerase [Kingella potus]UOP00316.1 peptidyl-prolyl cis-trans isomerase [Kingella potus]STR02624.1 peptidylprolyl isomerase [Kingella potus]